MASLEISLEGLTKLDLIELESSFPSPADDDFIVDKVAAPQRAGQYNDPALLTALIKIAVESAPTVLPILTSAIALWIAKGKKRGLVRDKKIEISWGGVKIATYEAENFSETDATAALVKLRALRSGGGSGE